ncbi:hypothetical protein FACS1894122_04200 [Alphaproteobacteria bacterium]|nr:hypothetical protein FACS1894122_04200 [Alphaproteobacteria bacterium]
MVFSGKVNSPITEDVFFILKQLEAHGHEARIVGGAVRNFLLNTAISDIDIATTALPSEVITIFKEESASKIALAYVLEDSKKGNASVANMHGTVTVVYNGKPYEITTLRRDVKTFGRKAQVEFTKFFEVDSCRRDFTMNAIYMDKNGRIFDYHNGIQDIADGNVRFIGEPAERIKEDYLRILRYFRFVALYGAYKVNEEYLETINSLKDNLTILSGERILSELRKILTIDDSYRIIPPMTPSLNALFDLSCNPLEICVQMETYDSLSPTERLGILLKFSKCDMKTLVSKYKFPRDISRFLFLQESGSSIGEIKRKLKTIRKESRKFFINYMAVLLYQQGIISIENAKALVEELEKFCNSGYVDFNFRADDIKDYNLSPEKLKDVMMATKNFWLTSEKDIGKKECIGFAITNCAGL